MEIYKLNDDAPMRRGLTKKHKCDRMGSIASIDAGDFGGAHEPTTAPRELKITDMKSGVRDENRVNIYINDKFAFSLDVAQVVDFHLRIGLVITADQLAEYKKASEFGKAYQRALEWVLMRPRSERELRDYLKRRGRASEAKDRQREWQREREVVDLVAKGEEVKAEKLQKRPQPEREKYDFDEIIVTRLIERGYIDDEKFARYYVENRFVKKGVSTRRLKMELQQKGVANDIIERVMSESDRDEADELQKMYAKKRLKYNDEKLIEYLCRQGFSYDMVKQLVDGGGA